jgi:Cu/Ag efflux protein CusF
MKRFTLAVAVVTAALTAGCISSDTLVKVNADGSGTIEERMMMSTSALNMLQSMGGEGKTADPFSEESLKKAAGDMGPGVRFVSAQPIEANDMKGSKVIYAFDDINAIQMKSSGAMPMSQGREAAGKKEGGDFAFKFDRTGGTPTLTITMPADREKSGAAAGEAPTETPEKPEKPDMPPEAMNMMKMMMKGLHIDVSIEVNGRITNTNATYHTGNQVTLIDMNFDELMNDPAALAAMQNQMGPGADPAAMKKALEKIKGVKIETEKVVTVQWR